MASPPAKSHSIKQLDDLSTAHLLKFLLNMVIFHEGFRGYIYIYNIVLIISNRNIKTNYVEFNADIEEFNQRPTKHGDVYKGFRANMSQS